MIERGFFDVTIAMDEHNEVSVISHNTKAKDGIEFSDVTLDNLDDNDNSDLIECDQEMIGREFFDVTIATVIKIQLSCYYLWRDICHCFC